MLKKIITSITLLIILWSCTKNETIDTKNIASTPQELIGLFEKKDAKIIRNHSDLLTYIKKDELLSEVFQKEELLIDYMYKTRFNKLGLMTYNYAKLNKYYPEKVQLINQKLAAGFGFNFDELADDYAGYECSPPATCKPLADNICIGDNCVTTDLFTPKHDLNILELIDVHYKYSQLIEPQFTFFKDDYSSFPIRKPSSWFFENFDLDKLDISKKAKEYLAKDIEKNSIIVFSHPIKVEGKSADVISLIFTKESIAQEFFEASPGLIVDNSPFTKNCTNLCLAMTQAGSGAGCNGCWTISCCNPVSCSPCSGENLDIADLMHPEFWNPDLDILSQMPISGILESDPVLKLKY